jgi:AraC-like DNA-binding protein
MPQKRPSAGAGYGLSLAPVPLDEDFPFVCGGRWEQRDQPITCLHLHQALELGFCHRGSGVFVVEDKVLPYRAGCVSVISEREMHLAQSTPGTSSTWTFMLADPARLLAGSGVDAALLATASLGGSAFRNIVAPEDSASLCRLVELLAEEGIAPGRPGHREAVRGLVLAIMAGLHRLPGRTAAGADRSAALRRLAPALGYLGSHYREEVDIPTLAAVCGLSPTHFRRSFTAAFGRGPLAYLVRFRLEKAAALLRDGAPVLESALRSGFSSLSSFQRHFRAAFGCPPRAWRRQQPG